MKLRGLVLVAVIAMPACKKDDNKGAAPASASASATGSGTASATGVASASGSGTSIAIAAPKAPPAAMAGFATIARSEAKAANGMAAGAGAGIGGALGGIFGGGGGAAAPAATDDKAAPANPGPGTSDVEPSDNEPSNGNDDDYDMSKIVFPPAGAKGGDCAAVADRIALMVKPMLEDQIKTMPADQQETARKMMGPAIHDQMVKSCTDDKWPADLRDCVLTAMDKDALQKCDDLSKNVGGDDTAAEPAQKPAPAWSGGHECADVGARMVELVLAQVPADQQEQVKKTLDDEVTELTQSCKDSGWTEAQRTCIVQAPTVDEAGNCLSSP